MTDLAAIADRATQIIGSADPSQFQSAFNTMVSETETVDLAENWETELGVISRMGMSEGVTVLETMKSAGQSTFGTDVIKRFIESPRGVNLADPQTVAFVNGLVSAGAITQTQADALFSTNSETRPKWPGLKPGNVQNALEQRAAGEV